MILWHFALWNFFSAEFALCWTLLAKFLVIDFIRIIRFSSKYQPKIYAWSMKPCSTQTPQFVTKDIHLYMAHVFSALLLHMSVKTTEWSLPNGARALYILYMWPICSKPVMSREIRFQDNEQKPYERHFFQLIHYYKF